jgi:hypothetical protein
VTGHLDTHTIAHKVLRLVEAVHCEEGIDRGELFTQFGKSYFIDHSVWRPTIVCDGKMSLQSMRLPGAASRRPVWMPVWKWDAVSSKRKWMHKKPLPLPKQSHRAAATRLSLTTTEIRNMPIRKSSAHRHPRLPTSGEDEEQFLTSTSVSFEGVKKNGYEDNSIAASSDSSSSIVLHEKPQQRRPKKSMRQVVQEYSDNDTDDDWEDTSTTSSAFLRRMWPRNNNKKQSSRSTQQHRPKSPRRSRSRSPGRRRRRKQTPTESESDDPIDQVRTDKGRTFSRPKSPRASDDWDDSVPIIPRTSSRRSTSPGLLRRVRSRSEERGRKKLGRTGRHSLDAVPQPSFDRSGLAPAAFPQMHPAHPLNQNSQQIRRDDMLDRQSYIMAHRDAFDGGGNNNVGNDDRLECQSFITAYRQGFGVTEANDDAMERQSFITAHRQGLDSAMHAPPPPPPPQQHPMMGSAPLLTHDDMMERHSFITAHRQGMAVQSRLPSGATCVTNVYNSQLGHHPEVDSADRSPRIAAVEALMMERRRLPLVAVHRWRSKSSTWECHRLV